MAKRKEEIGKGLRALLSSIDSAPENTVQKEEAVRELTYNISEIPLEYIKTNPFQPRKSFDDQELLDLAQSIKSMGLVQPITVRRIDDKTFQVISGERRMRASKLAGLDTIPCYIRLADDQGMLEMALVENIQRSDLNAVEIAISYQRLIEECDLSHEKLAERVGKDRSTITNYTRLLKLPPVIQAGLKSREISMGHARALITIEDPSVQLDMFKKIVDGKLSVRATEEMVKRSKSPTGKAMDPLRKSAEDLEVQRIRDRLSHLFGSKVDIQRSIKGKGKFIIHFRSDDQFNAILDQMEQ